MDKAEAIVERQLLRDLPVVLNEEVVVVINVAALEQSALLRVGLENTDSSVRVAEAGVKRVVGGVAEIERALDRQHPDALRSEVLNLHTVLRGEAALEGMIAPDLGQREVRIDGVLPADKS